MTERPTNEGRIHTYNHQGRIGVLLELRCETDFCARTSDFIAWCADIAQHIAATDPESVDELLAQPFVKNETVTVSEHLDDLRRLVGENIHFAGFDRREIK